MTDPDKGLITYNNDLRSKLAVKVGRRDSAEFKAVANSGDLDQLFFSEHL